jgi:predicted nucleic acid-binding protein
VTARARPVVIDASAAMAYLLKEPSWPLIAGALRAWSAQDRTIAVPAHFWLEVVNALGRRPGWTGQPTIATLHRLDLFGIQTIELDRPLVLRSIDLVERYRLTSYDAAYLAAAESIDGDLASLDRALLAAAGRRAIAFDDEHRVNEPPATYERDITWPNYKEASAYLAHLRAEALAERG